MSPTASQLGHQVLTAFPGELDLAFANLLEFLAPLDEGIQLGEDAVDTEIPLPIAGLLLDNADSHIVDLAPLFPALDTVLQVGDALLDISVEHVLDVDLALAPFDYFVGDLL